jgi:hypothetical protein
VFYETCGFIAIFARACHCSLTWAKWIHSTPSHHISVRFILILTPFTSRSPKWSFLFRFSSQHFFCIFHLCHPWSMQQHSWLRHYATGWKVAGSSPSEVIGFFHLTSSFQPHYGHGVDSASNRNEYQESSWGLEGGRCIRLTTSPPSVSWLSRQNVGASISHNPMGLHGLLQG